MRVSRSFMGRRGNESGEAVSLIAGGRSVLAKRRECEVR